MNAEVKFSFCQAATMRRSRFGSFARRPGKTSWRQMPAFFLLWAACFNFARGGEEIQFERISFEQGLFQSKITTILQDRKGCLWIGTSDGLNKFDGYRFTTYRYDPLDSTSISGNYIISVFEDRPGYFWITASGGGINRFDPATEKFKHYRYDPDNPDSSLSDDNITSILEDSRGNLWLGSSGGGLNLYDRSNDNFIHFKQSTRNPRSLSSNIIRVLLEDSRGNLWVGTDGGGLNKAALPEAPLTRKSAAALPGDNGLPLLAFSHFFAKGPTYHPEIFAIIDSLKNRSRLLASILYLQNYEESTDYFTIKKPLTVLVVAMGDGNAYGMADYGWIERGGSENTVWKMDYEKTNQDGGATRNRIQIEVLTLKPGQYNMHYRSDDQHSYNRWVNEPPEHPGLWGIQIFLLSPQEGREIAQKLKKRIVPNSISHNWITALDEDGEGNLWIGTADGLSCLRSDPGGDQTRFTVYKHESGNPASLNHSYISAIYRGGSGKNDPLWIITTPGEGLNRFDRNTGKVLRIPLNPNPESLNENYLNRSKITALLQDRNKNLWIGTMDGGLSNFTGASQQRALQENSPGQDKRGGRYSPMLFRHYQYDPLDMRSLSDNSITAIFEDRSGIIWVGTSRGGLNKIDYRMRNFRHYTHVPGNPQSLSDRVVTAILEDDSGALWVGTANGGLNKLERNTLNPFSYRYHHFRHSSENPFSLSNNSVSTIYQDQSGNLWIGTSGGGLNLFDNKTRRFKQYRYDPHISNSISGDAINSITEDQYGQLWIGTNSGLSKFDRFTEKFTQYRYNTNDAYSLSNNEVWAVYEDSYSQGKTLWIGTRAGGLNKFDRQNNRFVRYMRDFDNPYSLNNPAILSIYQDKAGNLWFGTYSGGLHKFNRASERFTFFTERDGLANNMIFGILEDAKGNLWLSTNKGISKFNPEKNTFRNYDVYDGLQANEFNPGAYCLAKNGEMFFGGVNGMSSFFPDSVMDNPYVPPVILTSFSVFDTSYNERLNRAIFESKPIQLSYRENFITIEFAALDYTNPRKNRYAYKLEGVNQSWVDCGTHRLASFTNLEPGSYIFRVKGSNNDGVWNEEGASVQIIITPPFWKTWWFYLLASIMGIFSILWLHAYRLHHKIKRLMEIEQVRMQENERVRAKAAHDFHDELGHKLTRINLFSEIARRTAMESSPEIAEYLNRIGETAKGLSGGMRDFIWTLDPGKDSLYEVAIRLKDFGDELFDKTGIAFRLEGLTPEMENARLSMDWRRHITLIFKEAMNNALKHSQCRNATLKIRLDGFSLEITLEDDGKGIPAAIFAGNGSDSDADIDSPGNGLNNMRFRAEKLGGKVAFPANRTGGTIVKFSGEIPQTGN